MLEYMHESPMSANFWYTRVYGNWRSDSKSGGGSRRFESAPGPSHRARRLSRFLHSGTPKYRNLDSPQTIKMDARERWLPLSTRSLGRSAPSPKSKRIGGSSNLHAFGDSNLYLRRTSQRLLLSSEHRAAPASPPVYLELIATDAETTHLQAVTELDGHQRRGLQEQVLGRGNCRSPIWPSLSG